MCESGFLATLLHSHSVILSTIPKQNCFQSYIDGNFNAWRLVNNTILVLPFFIVNKIVIPCYIFF